MNRLTLSTAAFLFAFVFLTFTSPSSAQDSLRVRQVGSYDDYLYRMGRISVVDDIGYLTTGRSGLYLLDVSDPTAITEIGHVPIQGNTYSATGSAGYAYVGLYEGDIYVFDISDPANPVEIGYSYALGYVYKLIIRDNLLFAFADGQNAMQIIDVSDPEYPQVIGVYSTNANIYDAVIDDDYAYLTDSTNQHLVVVDISDPYDLVSVGYVELEYCPLRLAKQDNYVYIGEIDILDYRMEVVDVTNPNFPLVRGNISLSGCPESIKTSDYRVFVRTSGTGYHENALLMINVADPDNPTMITSHYTEYYPGDVCVYEEELYFTENVPKALHVFDLNYQNTFEQIGTFEKPGEANGIIVEGDLAYITDDDGGLRVLDISNPENPHFVGSFDTPNYTQDVCIDGNTAFLADWEGDLLILDISDPASITQIGHCSTRGTARSVTVQGTHAYLGTADLEGISIVDISDPANPMEVATVSYYFAPRCIVAAGNYIYFVVPHWGLRIFDVQDPANPVLVSEHNAPYYGEDLVLNDGILFLADRHYGYYIFDVTDPYYPEEIYHHSYSTDNLAFQDGFLCNTREDIGMRIIDVQNPTSPILRGYYPTPGITLGVAIQGDYIYTAESWMVNVYSGRLALPVAESETRFVPGEFTLSPAYPNPFNAATTATLFLPTPADVQVTVYNLAGQQVAVLVDNRMQAGQHRLSFNAPSLASGTYFLQASMGGEAIQTNKITLVR